MYMNRKLSKCPKKLFFSSRSHLIETKISTAKQIVWNVIGYGLVLVAAWAISASALKSGA